MDDAEELGRVRDLDTVLEVIQEGLPDSVLYLEGSRRHMAPELVEFLEANPAPHPMQVAKGTIWPKSAKFHLATSRENLDRLREIDGRHADPEICDHLVVYRDGSVLLTAYDAGDGEVYVSKRLSADVIDRMRRIVGSGSV
jgi:hypothetical protein